MAPPFLPQVMPQANVRLDFSPINQAIDGIQNQRNRNRMMDFQREQFQADQDYKNRMMQLKEQQASQGPSLPWWAGQDGSIHPAMAAKLKATPSMGFAPIVIGGALVNRGTGETIRPAPKSPIDMEIERRLQGGSQAPTVQPQSAPAGATSQPFQDAVTPQYAAPPQQDPNLVQVDQEAQPAQPAVPPQAEQRRSMLNVNTETVTLMQGSKTYGKLGSAIAERQAARDAGVTFSKSTINDLQSDTLAKTNLLNDLRKIDASFKPEYQTYYTKARMESAAGG